MKRLVVICGCFSLLCACGPGVFSAPPPTVELHVAAAANLSAIFPSLDQAERARLGIKLVPSFGSTAQLTKQIESGAPFDLFLAADNEHPTALSGEGLAGQPREYARGRVVIYAPKHEVVQKLEDLSRPEIKVIAIANPDLAPYGRASVDALTSSGLWTRVQRRVVYSQNISAALAYADTGSADVALTAFSLIARKMPHAPLVPENLHKPIIQSLCTLNRTSHPQETEKVAEFLLGDEAGKILQANGYERVAH